MRHAAAVLRAWGVVLATVLVAAGTCGVGTRPGLSPPGTPLAAGLVVPVGAQLVGPVFARPPDPAAGDRGRTPVTSDVAVLRLDGDPFGAWDDLAGQAQDMGVPIGNSGICVWRATSAGAANRIAGYPGLPITGPRPDFADAMSCDAGATGSLSDGTQVMVQLSLWWWVAGAELRVEISEGDLSEYASSRVTVRRPAPATAVGELPDRDPQASVGPGDPFGRPTNCFATGSQRLTLPDGGRLIGGGNTPLGRHDFAAVLAVEDLGVALGDLRDQLDGPDLSDGEFRLSEERLVDGRTVQSLSGGATGGGGCDVWSSPDGTAVLVTATSD